MKRLISISWLVFMLFLYAAPAFSSQTDRMRIGVKGFESKAKGVSRSQAEIITDILTRRLASSRTIAVYERQQIDLIGKEIRLGMSGLVDVDTAVEVGRIAGVQYMLMGSVTELSQRTSGAVIPIPIFGGVGIGTGYHEASVTIDIRVVDTATSEIKLALSETGLSSHSAAAITVAGITYAGAGFGGLEARAIEDATNRLAHQIRTILGGEASHVIAVSGRNVIIDKGSAMGASEGSLYLVYDYGKAIRGMDGTILDYEKTPLAVIKIAEVSNAHSTATVTAPSNINMIRRGDRIEPITSSSARNMKFAASRPAPERSDTYRQVFADDGDGADGELPAISDESGADSPAADAPVRMGERREIPGFDPDTSTDAKVIETYNLDAGAGNILAIRHRGAMNKFNGQNYDEAYADFSGMANEFSGNYLAAYWAGVAAQRLENDDESLEWMEHALEINPSYHPAKAFKERPLNQ